MPWNPAGWVGASRARAPHERPRDYNDPSKPHELEHYYDRANWPDRLKTGFMLLVLVGIIALIGFIVFNIVFG